MGLLTPRPAFVLKYRQCIFLIRRSIGWPQTPRFGWSFLLRVVSKASCCNASCAKFGQVWRGGLSSVFAPNWNSLQKCCEVAAKHSLCSIAVAVPYMFGHRVDKRCTRMGSVMRADWFV